MGVNFPALSQNYSIISHDVAQGAKNTVDICNLKCKNVNKNSATFAFVERRKKS